jgi:hypothetical protein
MVQRPPCLPVPPRLYQRHSADPARAKNAYVPEDQITPHLAALAILLASHENGPPQPEQASQVTGPAQAAELIDYLRSSGQTLTYDPQRQTLRTGTGNHVAIMVGRCI